MSSLRLRQKRSHSDAEIHECVAQELRAELKDGSHRQEHRLPKINRAFNAKTTNPKAGQRQPEAMLDLLARLSKLDGDIHLLLAAVDSDLHRVARTVVIHHLRKIILALDLLAVDGNDEIASERDL